MRLERGVRSLHLFEVRGAVFAVSDRVQLEPELAQPDLVQPSLGELDDLRVQRCASHADGLDVELGELPVAAFLGPVVSEHRADQVETRGLRALVETSLEVSPDNSSRGLWPQRQVSTAAIVEAVQLFGDRVGVLADALDQPGVLAQGGRELLTPQASRHIRGALFGGPPDRAFTRKDVAHSADGFDRLRSGHKSDDCTNLRLLSVAGDYAHRPDRRASPRPARPAHGP